MKQLQLHRILFSTFVFLLLTTLRAQQGVDRPLTTAAMLEDLDFFERLRKEENSGLYVYRTPAEIERAYAAARTRVQSLSTVGEFYTLICELTDMEGSVHNGTGVSGESMGEEFKRPTGFFPFPILDLGDRVVWNSDSTEIPAGSEIVSVNGHVADEMRKRLGPYYTTDADNLTGKRFGFNRYFFLFYRIAYGLSEEFTVVYSAPESNETKTVIVSSKRAALAFNEFNNRRSRTIDGPAYQGGESREKKRPYTYRKINDRTGLLTVNSFQIGNNKKDKRHLTYVAFLDSTFRAIHSEEVERMIVDVRYNGGGTDPNDQVTYQYFADRPFRENTAAWVSAVKMKRYKHLEEKPFWPVRFLHRWGMRKQLRKMYPDFRDGRHYSDLDNDDNKVRQPADVAFTGPVYLLISPRIASAGSMFAAMLAGQDNVTVIGEETMGGYYKHNGHRPVSYVLPNSEITTTFSIVNLDQDVEFAVKLAAKN